MAKTIRAKNEYQQNIVKMLNSLAGRYSRWTVWQDFITMAAVAICNSVPHPHREVREKLYMHAGITMGIEANPQQDFLGELFMALDMGNEWRGQFFTPYSVCSLMAAITLTENILDKVKHCGWADVNDPACGAGALLIAFANACLDKGVNYQQQVLFVGQDIDQLAGMMCYIQLSLLGCAGYVAVKNTLTNPVTSYDARGLLPKDDGNIWYMPMYYSDIVRRFAAKIKLLAKDSLNGKHKGKVGVNE